MTTLDSVLRRIVDDLTRSGHRFALVGGLAVSVRSEPRFTRDADLAVAVAGDADAEALVMALRDRGYRETSVLEQQATGRMATVRLSLSMERNAPVIDLLFASSGIEPEVVSEAEDLEVIAGLTLRVARTGHLIALKILARDDINRPQDIVDLRALLKAVAPDELERARQALALIATRGYHRGRSLQADLATLVGAS